MSLRVTLVHSRFPQRAVVRQMNVLTPDAFLCPESNDPLLPCTQSSSDDSLHAFREARSNRRVKEEVKEEAKEETDDWNVLPAQEDTIDVHLDYSMDTEMEIGPSASWNDFCQSLKEESSIQEIIVHVSSEETEKEPAIIENIADRKRYQRFREKKFVCDDCDRCFTLKQNVQQHLMIYHMNGSKQLQVRTGKRFKCLKCDMVFKTLDNARRHDSAKHGVKSPGLRVFKCEQCTKVYPTSSALKEHVIIHHLKERPFECEQCGIRFGRKGGLRRHMQMVHENQLFKCPFPACSHPGYKCTKALAAHIRSVHTKDRPFVCMLCDRTFVRKNDLKTHEMTHQATACFVCPCSKAFKRLAGLRAHKKRCRVVAVKREEEEKEEGKRKEKGEAEGDPPSTLKIEEEMDDAN